MDVTFWMCKAYTVGQDKRYSLEDFYYAVQRTVWKFHNLRIFLEPSEPLRFLYLRVNLG
jgi:hypothetical protein